MTSVSELRSMTPHEIEFEIARDARFVAFQYCVSAVVITFRRSTSVQYVKAGESAAMKSLLWTLLSFVLGWWGIPWGFIYTPMVLYKNLKGGVDATASVLARAQAAAIIAPAQMRATG